MMGEPGDFVQEYRSYLDRFEKLMGGDVAFGSPAKWKGKLLAKLSYEQFESRWQEFVQFEAAYQQLLDRGDTMNDAMLKLLRDRSAELLLDRDF